MKATLKHLILGLTLFITTGCVGVDPAGRGYSVAIPTGVINQTLASNFPVQQKMRYGTLNIADPNILGQSGSQKLGVGTAFSFSNFLIPKGVSGNVQLSSGLRYDPQTKSIYLSNPMVTELKFQNFSLSRYLTPQMQQTIGLVIAQTIAKRPIYNLGKSGMASNLVRGIDVRNGQVYVTFGL